MGAPLDAARAPRHLFAIIGRRFASAAGAGCRYCSFKSLSTRRATPRALGPDGASTHKRDSDETRCDGTRRQAHTHGRGSAALRRSEPRRGAARRPRRRGAGDAARRAGVFGRACGAHAAGTWRPGSLSDLSDRADNISGGREVTEGHRGRFPSVRGVARPEPSGERRPYRGKGGYGGKPYKVSLCSLGGEARAFGERRPPTGRRTSACASR